MLGGYRGEICSLLTTDKQAGGSPYLFKSIAIGLAVGHTTRASSCRGLVVIVVRCVLI